MKIFNEKGEELYCYYISSRDCELEVLSSKVIANLEFENAINEYKDIKKNIKEIIKNAKNYEELKEAFKKYSDIVQSKTGINNIHINLLDFLIDKLSLDSNDFIKIGYKTRIIEDENDEIFIINKD